MPVVFLHAPLARPEIAARVLGAAPTGRPARLGDHVLRAGASGGLPLLLPGPGPELEGVSVALDGTALARLDFALAAFGGLRVPVEGMEICAARDGAVMEPPDCSEEAAAHLAETLDELMDHFGQVAAADLPRLMSGLPARALARVRGRSGAAPHALRLARAPSDVTPLAVARPYAAFFGIEEHRLAHRRFDGTMTVPLDRAVFVSGDAVTVLPYDPRRDAVLLIEQFRAGPFARRDPLPWCLEAVAGRCDPGERPEDTARREAVEEAGLTLGRMERIAAYYTTPGCAAEFLTSFVAEADLSAAGGNHGLADEHEDIRTVVLARERAQALVATGEVNNAPLLISLMWLQAHHDRLSRDWATPPRLDAPDASR
jgi:nudix-type nucleoside diphosphatase (YffH/AdpP family)